MVVLRQYSAVRAVRYGNVLAHASTAQNSKGSIRNCTTACLHCNSSTVHCMEHHTVLHRSVLFYSIVYTLLFTASDHNILVPNCDQSDSISRNCTVADFMIFSCCILVTTSQSKIKMPKLYFFSTLVREKCANKIVSPLLHTVECMKKYGNKINAIRIFITTLIMYYTAIELKFKMRTRTKNF